MLYWVSIFVHRFNSNRTEVFKKILSTPTGRYTLYLIVSVLIGLILTLLVDKYQAQLISTSSSVDYLYYFEDLNGDGNSEKISYNLRYNDRLSIMIFTGNRVIGQWNFHGAWANTASPFFADYDQDGIKEIFVFTLQKDTIYMHCLDVFNRKIETKNKAVCKVNKIGDDYDFIIFPCAVYDVNADGYKEFFFSIRTGFSTVPRNMFVYYPVKNTIRRSPESCSSVMRPVMFDMDGDTIPEFISSLTYATDNCEIDKAFSDLYSWLMVFTPEMEFKFPPVRFEGYPAISWFIPYKCGGKNYYLVMHFYRGTENFPSFMALFGNDGKMIRKKDINMDESWFYSTLFSRDDDYKNVYILKSDTIMSIDSMLNIHYEARFKHIAKNNHVKKMDIDCDGENEFLFTGQNNKEIIVFRNDFSKPVTLKLNEDIVGYQLSVIKKRGDLPRIFIDTDKNFYTFIYKTTVLHSYRYVLFIPLFLLITFSGFVVQKTRKYRQLKTDNTQRQIAVLQVKSIQNQLDPHFTFNIFSSFANLINEKDTERANYIFGKYAGLLKASVMNSENIQIKLQEELDFVTSYLELEKFRFPGRFSFTINMRENIDRQLRIPKMLMHIFVENAVKHGLRHLDSGGELLIDGQRDRESLYISITDNGIGRAKAKTYAGFSTGKGLSIMNQILDSYYSLYRIKITYRIIDLFHNNSASGTKVIIRIPVRI